jgi:D-amino peptidase
VDFDATHPVTAVTAIPGVDATGDRGVTFSLPTMVAAIRCFKAVTVLAAASVEDTYG